MTKIQRWPLPIGHLRDLEEIGVRVDFPASARQRAWQSCGEKAIRWRRQLSAIVVRLLWGFLGAKRKPVVVPCILCLLLVCSLCGGCLATEVVSTSDEIRIHRHLASITLREDDVKEKSFFFDVNGLVERTTLPNDEAIEVGKAATNLLRAKLRLVSEKAEASYLVQIRVDRLTNYAIRNPKHQPSRGQVMISLCRLPIMDAGADCGNLTFFSFSTFQAVEALRKAFPIWISMTMQPR